MIRKSEIHGTVFLIGLLSFILALFPAFEGFPFIVHWDEELVYRRPFRRVFQYISGDFSSPTNLFDLFLLIWYVFGYGLGRIIGYWADFSEFQEHLIMESGIILVWGRLLSAIYLSIGNCLIHLFFTKLTHSSVKVLLTSLCLVFNPFLYPSLILIKFDGLVYLFTCILLISSFRYFRFQDSYHRKVLYFVGFLSLSLRVELLLFIVMAIGVDLWKWRKNPSKNRIRPLIKPIGLGLSLSLIFTLYPVSYLYKYFFPQKTIGLASRMSYGENIVRRIFTNIQQVDFLSIAGESLAYYGELLISILGPFIGVIFLVSQIREPFSRIYLIHLIAFGGILGFFGVNLVHYAVSPSLIILFVTLQHILQDDSKWKPLALVISLVFMSSISIQYSYLLYHTKSPAVRTHQFLLENTHPQDLIAIETLSGAAFHPHLTECRAAEKIRVAKQVSKYGGSELEIQIKKGMIQPCRNQLDICEINYLSANPDKSNDFVNTFDISQMKSLQPKWFVTTHPLQPPYPTDAKMDSFFQYMNYSYVMDTLLDEQEGIIDPRVRMINIRRTFYLFRRKDSLPIFQFSK